MDGSRRVVRASYSDARHQREFARLIVEPDVVAKVEHETRLHTSDLVAMGFVHEGRFGGGHEEQLFFDLILDEEEATQGGEFAFTIPLRHRCYACAGAGRGRTQLVCTVCRGEGEVTHEPALKLSVPPGVQSGRQAVLPLALLGLEGGMITLTVRVE
jgi:hypothetical protein